MPDVFISYRRGDSAGHAGRLSDSLSAHYGRDHVFMDLDAISPGADFVERIEQAVGSCHAALVLIGDDWVNATDQGGRRRLDDPNDFVRLEIAEALARDGIQVIPVLVEGAKMPDPDDLPEDIRPLSRRNAIELSDQRWSFDVDRLTKAIAGTGPRIPRPRRGGRVPAWALVAGGAAVAGAIVAGVVLAGGGGGDAGVKVREGAYAGTLSGGEPLRFAVRGGEVRDIQFDAIALCQSSQGLPEARFKFPFRALPSTKAPVRKDGTFQIRVDFPEQTFRMEGDFTTGGRAEGNLRSTYFADQNGNGPVGDGPYSCDTSALGWTAQG
jgi:hypothetical protein